jgi:hypothetical protein
MSTPLSSPRSTVFYDEDGFPDIISGMYSTPISAKQLVPSNDLSPEPMIPTTKERKNKTLATRANLKSASPAPASKPSEESNKGLGRSLTGLDIKIHSPKLSVTPDRLELCALDDANKRVFIYGATKKGYGEDMEEHGKAVKNFIEMTEGVTKGAALAFKNELRNKRS